MTVMWGRVWVTCCETYWRAEHGDDASWLCLECGSEAEISMTGPVTSSAHHMNHGVSETIAERWAAGRLIAGLSSTLLSDP